MILDYQTNILTTVESKDQGLWKVVTRTDDTLFSAKVSLEVAVPALDIRDASIEVQRDFLGMVGDLSARREKLIGVRVGAGMTKIVRGVMGGEGGSDRVVEMVLEAMEMLINALTVPELRKGMEAAAAPIECESDGPRVFLNDVAITEDAVKLMSGNPRLKDSCAAFRGLGS